MQNDASPGRRVILLGASNLTRAFPTIVATARKTWRGPIEIMAAMGHGRSFGQDSSVLGRKISGIFPCALWQDLQNRPALPTAALVTDVGNDLLYGVAPDRLIEWVENCLVRLEQTGATIVMTQLPVSSVQRLDEARFKIFRTLFFPRSRLTLGDAKVMVGEFNERLKELGEARNIPVIPVSAEWYGFDPIHLKRRVLRQVWPQLLLRWHGTEKPVVVTRPSWRSTIYLASRMPVEQSIFGIPLRAKQPSGRLEDGTTIWLY